MNLNEMTVASLVASEHFQNHCLNPTAESVQYWEQQLFQYPEKREIIEEAKTLVLALAMKPSDEEVSAAFLDFKKVIEQQQIKQPTKLVALPRQQKSKKSSLITIAATILFVLSIGVWQFFLAPTTAMIELTTNYGELKTQLLPDGSKIILNANSRLTFKEHWTRNKPREVQLQGEAFFEIKKKSTEEQFIVQTDKGKIQVLGTSFNVKQRAATFEVALLEGAVALSIPKYPVIKMKPGELVRVEGTDFYDRSIADVDAFSAWRFQRMVFKEMAISKVIQRLQDEFNWEVTVANQDLLKRKITATIPKNDPELLLEALSEIYDLEIEQLNDKAYLIK
ncbi:MAG: FecR family protein [Saprospiraceae bacterium]